MKQLAGFVFAALILVGFWLLVMCITSPKMLDLTELNVRLPIEYPSHFSYIAKDEPKLSKYFEIQTRRVNDASESPCILGLVFMLPKDLVASSIWTEASLREMAVPKAGIPPPVKEFGTGYVIYEPSTALCATNASDSKMESEDRADLLASISKALTE